MEEHLEKLKNAVGDYLICTACKDVFFCCNTGELLLPWDCNKCGSKKTVVKKEE